jgi:hypothetical protein
MKLQLNLIEHPLVSFFIFVEQRLAPALKPSDLQVISYSVQRRQSI